jgi:O-antigen/teichoic acid export membrane protein
MKTIQLHSKTTWAFLAQGINISTGLLLLPLIVRYLSPHEVGLWFVFISLVGLAQLLELGFQPTISRNVTYVYSGAQALDESGYAQVSENSSLNESLLHQLFLASKKIYLYISLLILLFLIIVGSVYILSVLPQGTYPFNVLFAWFTFALGSVISVYFGYYNGFLIGRGNLIEANKIIVYSRVLLIAFCALSLICGLGLIGIAIATLIASALGRVIANRFFWQCIGSESKLLKSGNKIECDSLIKILWPNARKHGWADFGGFIASRGTILVASSFLGLSEAGSYGLSFQVLYTLYSFSFVFLGLELPKINRHQIRGEYEQILLPLAKSIAVGWIIFIIGSIIVLLFGNMSLEMIGSQSYFLESRLMFLFVVIMFLEMNQGLCGTYLTTFNEIPFARSSLITGVFVIITGIFLVHQFSLGILGLLFAKGLIQAAYGNWKWPLELAKKNQITYFRLVFNGFLKLFSFNHN